MIRSTDISRLSSRSGWDRKQSMRNLIQILPVPAVGEADDSAADLPAGIAGRLGVEVVGHLVHHHGFSQNLGNNKPFVIERNPGVSLIGKKGKKIPGMVRVLGLPRVIMSAGVGKVIAAVPVFMDMESIKIRRARLHPVREAK